MWHITMSLMEEKIPVSTASKVFSKGTSTNYNWFSHTNLKIGEGAESCHSHVPYLHQCDSVVSTKSQHFTPTISCKHSQAWAWKKVGQTSKKAGGGPRRIVIQMNNNYCLISSWCPFLLFSYHVPDSEILSKSTDNLIAAYTGRLMAGMTHITFGPGMITFSNLKP